MPDQGPVVQRRLDSGDCSVPGPECGHDQPRNGRRPVPVSPAAGKEAGLAGIPARPHSGSGGHRRAFRGGGGEEPHRRLGAGHDHQRDAPGIPALLGGPDVEACDPGAPGQQGRGAHDRDPAAAHGGALEPGAHPDCRQWQGACRPPGDLRRTWGGIMPCHSRERDPNEIASGLVRQYFRQTRVTAEKVRQVKNSLNHRPRKVLGCRMPFEVFREGLPSP
ncbi:MAG: hypothetical protein OXF73_04035 [Gammaproteobacteria bacterium]|nr:hypothetical protein [Gammaproteobacteria bacterium]